MKKPNSVSEFTSERNEALIANFRKKLTQQSAISVETAIKGAAEAPAPRFWVSEQRAAVVISRMLKADHLIYNGSEKILASMYKEKREMYREIYARIKALIKENPGMAMPDAIFEVINQPAPRSYISVERLKNVIYSEIKRRRRERALK